MEIKFKQGSRLKTSDPVIVYNELERIRKANNNHLTAELVVQASKNKQAPLHPEFEWNDKKAGHLWRVFHARRVIGSIEIIKEEKPTLETRAYEVVYESTKSDDTEPPRKVYRGIEDILSDPVARSELLGQAIRDAIAFRRRYYVLSELSKMIKAVDEFIKDAKVG